MTATACELLQESAFTSGLFYGVAIGSIAATLSSIICIMIMEKK